MKLFDSHCHLDDRSFERDFGDVMARAEQNGVKKIMVVGIALKSCKRAVELAEKYDRVYASVGIHPHDASDCDDKTIGLLKDLAKSRKVKAWGETGLDFNRMFSPREQQEKWFFRQLEMAGELGLPLIFHERDSDGRFLEILKDRMKNGQKGVVHCFSGNRKELLEYLALGLYIGVTGIATIEKRGEDLRKLLPLIPSDRLLIETDAPYLTPAPEKNKTRRNEPAFVKSVMLKIAEVRGENLGELSQAVWENTHRLYGIEDD